MLHSLARIRNDKVAGVEPAPTVLERAVIPTSAGEEESWLHTIHASINAKILHARAKPVNAPSVGAHSE